LEQELGSLRTFCSFSSHNGSFVSLLSMFVILCFRVFSAVCGYTLQDGVFFPPKGAGSAEGAAAAGGTLRLSKKALKRRAAEAEAHSEGAQVGGAAEQAPQGGAAAGSC
jgi:hypothetical protein